MTLATYDNIKDALGYLSPDVDQKEWSKIAMAIKDGLAGDGFELFDGWSKDGCNYDSSAAKSVWNAAKSGSIKVGTLFFLAGEKGWKPNADAKQETAAEKAERLRAYAERQAKDEAERAKKAANALTKTKQLIKDAVPVTNDHPYLLKKGVTATETLREISAEHAKKILGYAPKSNDKELTGRLLIAPIGIDGTLSTAEIIDEHGNKSAIAGGAKSAGYWLSQPLPETDDNKIIIAIAEGVSTTLTIWQSGINYAIAALSAGNMPKVAHAMRLRYPSAEIIICADVGNGQQYAEQAAKETQSLLAIPEFDLDQLQEFTLKTGKEPTDFNDLQAIVGVDAVAEQLHALILQTEKPSLSPSDTAAIVNQTVSAGLWWQPADLIIEDKDTVIITQRIADATALHKAGHKAVAIIDLKKFPMASFAAHFRGEVKWLIGFDRDKKTSRYIDDFVEVLTDAEEKTALIALSEDDVNNDWANCHKLTDKHITRYQHIGGIVGSKSKEEKCFHTFLLNDGKIRHCVIDFKNSTYSCDIDSDSYNGVYELTAFLPIAKISRIFEAKLDYLYHQEPDNGEDGKYVFRVSFANFAPSKELILGHTAFVSGSKFKEAALRVAGMMFDGETKDVNYLYKKWMSNWKKTVKTLDYVGYDKATKAYIFNDYAFQDGKVIPLNDEGYFSLPSGDSIKTIMDNGQVINLAEPINWFPDYEKAYSKVGLVALAWSLGSLFAEQIRDQHASYPFFELSGHEGGTGKSHLVEVINKIMGREYAPFNPVTSRPAARMRRFADSSNLPIYCNESENEDTRAHVGGFSWNELKDAFEGKGIRSIGVKSSDNKTKTPPFRVTLMIIQNVPVHADTPFLQRIVHQTLTSKHHTPEGRNADMRLMQARKQDMSGWLVKVLTQEKVILERFFARYAIHNARMQKNAQIKTQRIMHNHSQLSALIDCLDLVVPIGASAQHDLLSYAEKMAIEREVSLRKDHPIVQQFWDNYHYLSSCVHIEDADGFPILDPLNHSVNDNEIAVNLNEFRKWSFEKRQETMDDKELKRHLVSGISHKFIESNRTMTSRLTKKSIRVWVFKRGAS